MPAAGTCRRQDIYSLTASGVGIIKNIPPLTKKQIVSSVDKTAPITKQQIVTSYE